MFQDYRAFFCLNFFFKSQLNVTFQSHDDQLIVYLIHLLHLKFLFAIIFEFIVKCFLFILEMRSIVEPPKEIIFIATNFLKKYVK